MIHARVKYVMLKKENYYEERDSDEEKARKFFERDEKMYAYYW